MSGSAPGKRSPYITPVGFAALEAEADDLWKRRREVVKHLSAAAAEGDRSENAEYIYRKKQLREMDRRIRYLQKRLPELEVVRRDGNAAVDKVYFGAAVTLEDEQGDKVVYRIVGSDEFNPGHGWISIDSPVARALLGRVLEDEVSVRTPGGDRLYWVVDITY
ncbi:MAG: transcription elongation factor GreB [Pseudomonadota bacterium]